MEGCTTNTKNWPRWFLPTNWHVETNWRVSWWIRWCEKLYFDTTKMHTFVNRVLTFYPMLPPNYTCLTHVLFKRVYLLWPHLGKKETVFFTPFPLEPSPQHIGLPNPDATPKARLHDDGTCVEFQNSCYPKDHLGPSNGRVNEPV